MVGFKNIIFKFKLFFKMGNRGGGGICKCFFFFFYFGGGVGSLVPLELGYINFLLSGERDFFSLDRWILLFIQKFVLYISSLFWHLPFYFKVNSQVSKYQRVIHLNCSKKRLRGHPNIVQFYSAASLNEKETEHGMSEYLILTELCSGKA